MVPQAKMGEPLPDLTAQQLGRFNVGRVKYSEPLTIVNGLGPVFNKSSCGNCHNNPVGGTGSQTVTRFGSIDKGVFDPMDSLGGSLLQASGISEVCLEEIPEIEGVEIITQLRVTNGLLGYGLVEAILDGDMLAVRDAQDPSIQGIAHMVTAFEDPPPKNPEDPPILHVGRFGWKAQVATILTFSADASLNEMGLTNRFILTENDPNGTDAPSLGSPDFCDTVADPEDGPDGEGLDFIDHVTFFQRFLANAPQTPKSGMAGEVLFNSLGCAACHTPSFTTSNAPELEDAIRNKVIRPYSDFLLHQMGQQGDPIVQGQADQGLVKTPPLWGLRKRDPMWHNGSASPQGNGFPGIIGSVITKHQANGSQAKPAGDAYFALTPVQQDQVIAFLGSLGQAEFDVDLDNDVQIDDFVGLHGCFGSGITPDDPCAIHDIDQDGDADLDDFSSFMLVYVGPRRDCNDNDIVDLQDILLGTLLDTNDNGFADACEPTCDADITGGGEIDVLDLLAVISGWGTCPASPLPCEADVDFNGTVNVLDLLAIISSWGPCL